MEIPDIPVPEGATADRDWPSITADGISVRGLTWSHHDTDKVCVSVCGEQFASDGHYTREIMLIGGNGAIDGLEAADARDLADALTDAATTMDNLQ